MNSGKTKEPLMNGHSLEQIESPFVSGELFAAESQAEVPGAYTSYADETPFANVDPKSFAEEVIGTDERTLVADPFSIPNRWICAIDILVDNPKWGTSTSEPKYISRSRGTGVLIGPRYVLTAAHILKKQTIEVDGQKKVVDVKGLTVGAARNGSNSKNPFGKVASKTIKVSKHFFILRKVRQGGKDIEIPIKQVDDYALIILEKDLAATMHSGMNGKLGFWGQDRNVALVKRLPPTELQGKRIVVTGYPGDTCGRDKFSGTKPEKEKKIAYCWNRRNDEWASTQWRCAGTLLQAEALSTTLYHTADTYEGESGAPMCLTIDQKLHLVGIHTGSDNPQRNEGLRVTRRMLKELRSWINEDAGAEVAIIKDDALFVSAATGAPSNEYFTAFDEDGNSTTENAEQWRTTEYSEEADDAFERTDEEESLSDIDQEAFYEYDVYTPSLAVTDALNNKNWQSAIQLAIGEGCRDENQLTNLVFFARHPELGGRKLEPDKNKDDGTLSQEWSTIQNKEVWKQIEIASENTDLVVSGSEVVDHHRRFFTGKHGKRLKKFAEDAAREVNLNPGLLATVMMAETRRPLSYLSSGKVSSYHVGTDDFYEGQSAIQALVPANAKVGWDRKQKPIEHLNDAKKPRLIKTIFFDSGPDAVLATAVYLKFREVRLREIAAELGKDFVKLPLPTQFALTRIAMAAGTSGATPYLREALNGKDIFIRKNIPVRAYQTQRNATVRTAQVMHLSEWVFGIAIPAAVAPQEPETVEGSSEETPSGYGRFVDDNEQFYEEPHHEHFVETDPRNDEAQGITTGWEEALSRENDIAEERQEEFDRTDEWESEACEPEGEGPFELPADAPSLPNDATLQSQLRTIGSSEAIALEKAFKSIGKRDAFAAALEGAVRAMPEQTEKAAIALRLYLMRLGAEAFVQDIKLPTSWQAHIGFIDDARRLNELLILEERERFLQFGVRRLLAISAQASTPEVDRRQMNCAVVLFQIFQAELAAEYRLIIAAKSTLLQYRTLMVQIIWKHYQALLDRILKEAAKTSLHWDIVEKTWEKDMKLIEKTLALDSDALLPTFAMTPALYQDYFTPSSATDIGYKHYTSTPTPLKIPDISFEVAYRRREEQLVFLKWLHEEWLFDPLPQLHDSASWQGWIQKTWSKPLLRREDKLEALLKYVMRYFETFTIHCPLDLREGCKEKNYLTRQFPRAVTGSLVHDCAVYAVRWLHILGGLLTSAATGLSKPRIFLIEMPAHVGVLIRAERILIGKPAEIIISINNKYAAVYPSERDDTDEFGAQKVVQDMYAGMKVPFVMRHLSSKPSNAVALGAETCKIFDRKLVLPYSDLSEPHLRYLRHNATMAQIARDVFYGAERCWGELQKKRKPVTKAQIRDYATCIEGVVKVASERYEKEIKPLISEINDDIQANGKRLAKGVVVYETFPNIPWLVAYATYRRAVEKAISTGSTNGIHPRLFFPEPDFAAVIE
jgi:V8-like Glu-specific endopeptidase